MPIVACLALAGLLLSSAAAQQNGALEKIPPPDHPTFVYFGISVTTLRKIDVVDSSFILEAYLNFGWRDDRLYQKLVDNVGLSEDEDFAPLPEFLNAATDPHIFLDYAIVGPDKIPSWMGIEASGDANETYVLAYGRKSDSFIAELDLKEFPFDRQNMTLKMESSTYQVSEVVFVPRDVTKGLTPTDIRPSGWDHLGNAVNVYNTTYPALQEAYCRSDLIVQLQRQYRYYVDRVIANIILLVVMGCGVAFIGSREADRLGFVQASFAAVIGWLFVLASETPKLGYSTRLDSFVNASFGALFAQYVYHCFAFGYADWIVRALKVTAYKEDGSDKSGDDDDEDSEDEEEKEDESSAEYQRVDRRVKRAIGLPVPPSPLPSVRGNPLTMEEPRSVGGDSNGRTTRGGPRRANSVTGGAGRRVAGGVTAGAVRQPVVMLVPEVEGVELEMETRPSTTATTAAGSPSRPLSFSPSASSSAASSAAALEIYRGDGATPARPRVVIQEPRQQGNVAASAISGAAGPTKTTKPVSYRQFSIRKAEGRAKKAEKPSKLDWLKHRRKCGTWPCSFYGEWSLWNPKRRIDCVVTSTILFSYAIAVAVILGGGVALTKTPVGWER